MKINKNYAANNSTQLISNNDCICIILHFDSTKRQFPRQQF